MSKLTIFKSDFLKTAKLHMNKSYEVQITNNWFTIIKNEMFQNVPDSGYHDNQTATP